VPRTAERGKNGGKLYKKTTTWVGIAAEGQQPLGPVGGEKQDGTVQHSARLSPVEEQRTTDVKGGRTANTTP